jgi:hypothetical protein
MIAPVRQALGAVSVLIGVTGAASAATVSVLQAETASMLLIGAGLIIGAKVSRTRRSRG